MFSESIAAIKELHPYVTETQLNIISDGLPLVDKCFSAMVALDIDLIAGGGDYCVAWKDSWSQAIHAAFKEYDTSQSVDATNAAAASAIQEELVAAVNAWRTDVAKLTVVDIKALCAQEFPKALQSSMAIRRFA